MDLAELEDNICAWLESFGELFSESLEWLDDVICGSNVTPIVFSEEEVNNHKVDSDREELIEHHLLENLQQIEGELTELKAKIDAHHKILSMYVVGSDKSILNALCDHTVGKNLQDNNIHVQALDGLHFEGVGGLMHEENTGFYQLAYSFIHAVRYLLDIVTWLSGYQCNQNKLAEAALHRPFFFQVPCSPQEKIEIKQEQDALKNAVKQVYLKQEALNDALNGPVDSDNESVCSNYSLMSG